MSEVDTARTPINTQQNPLSPQQTTQDATANQLTVPASSVPSVIKSLSSTSISNSQPNGASTPPKSTNPADKPSSTSSPSASPASTEPRRRTVQDFEFGRSLGDGSYSSVVAAKEITTGKEFAVKILDKRHIVKEKKVKYVNIEKTVLNTTRHPFIVKLYYTFQDAQSLFFVIEIAQNGELLSWIRRLGSFDERCTRFYAAEIISAIEYLHSKGILHRDLKPENILLDEKMHIKLTDFGTAKILEPIVSNNTVNGVGSNPDPALSTPSPAKSFVGTAEYVSPELLNDKAACKASDIWAIGCIIYQLLAGRPPFKGSNDYQTFQKITKLDYSFPEGFPEVAKDLVRKILVLNPTQRLGAEGINQVKQHQFFDGVDWNNLHLQTPPALTPYLPPSSDTEELRSNLLMLKVPPSSSSLDFRDPFVDELASPGLLSVNQRPKANSNASISPLPTSSSQQPSRTSLSASVPSLSSANPSSSNVIPTSSSEQRSALLNSQKLHKYAPFLTPNELIIKCGKITKRKGLFSKKRYLILTDKPRLFYIDEDKVIIKGEMTWNSSTEVELKNNKVFFVHTSKKTYYCVCVENKAEDWVEAIQVVKKWMTEKSKGKGEKDLSGWVAQRGGIGMV